MNEQPACALRAGHECFWQLPERFDGWSVLDPEGFQWLFKEVGRCSDPEQGFVL